MNKSEKVIMQWSPSIWEYAVFQLDRIKLDVHVVRDFKFVTTIKPSLPESIEAVHKNTFSIMVNTIY